MTTLGIGVIGCGNISTAYFSFAPLFSGIEMRACADLDMEAAKRQAERYGMRAMTVEDLLGTDDIDIVVNLTVPDAHFAVSKAILQAGKHAYSEKPLVLSMDDANALKALAEETGLRVGAAPDTFLGGANQRARALIDDGVLGRITSATAIFMNHGMEHWHPNPDFFFKPGGGPILDMGPYYISALVNLIGPVRRVAALSSIPTGTRTILSEPRNGETIDVETPTNIHALLEFANGATATFIASWNVWAHRHENMELYGTDGSLYVPDPNFFGGSVLAGGKDRTAVEAVPDWNHPLARPNETKGAVERANYRAAGLAEMAQAIVEGRPHRCSLDVAIHIVDAMTAILASGENGDFITLSSTCDRPAALTPDQARTLMADAE